MSRHYWQIYTLASDNETWELDSDQLYIPNNEDEFNFEEISTMTIAPLIDGSDASLLPSNKYRKTPITMIWFNIPLEFLEQIRDYQRSGEVLKIVTGVSGRDFIGRLSNWKPNWASGAEDEYDMEVTFTPLMSFE